MYFGGTIKDNTLNQNDYYHGLDKGIEKRLENLEKKQYAKARKIQQNLYSINNTKLTVMDPTSSRSLGKVLSFANVSEKNTIVSLIRSSIENANKDILRDVELKSRETSRYVQSFSSWKVDIKNGADYSEHVYLNTAIKRFMDLKQKEFNEYQKVKIVSDTLDGLSNDEAKNKIIVPSEKPFELDKNDYLDKLRTIVNDNNLERRSVRKIANNIDKIATLQMQNDSLQKEIDGLSQALMDIDGKLFKSVKEYIGKIIDERRKTIKHNNAILNRIVNFDELKILSEKAKLDKFEKAKQEENERKMLSHYEELASQLEELKDKNASPAEINRIKSEMEFMRNNTLGDLNSKLVETGERVTQKYAQEREYKRLDEKVKLDEVEKARLKHEALKSLDIAIKARYDSRHGNSWKFKPISQNPEEYQSIKSELLREAELTPEQRALDIAIKKGEVNPDATLETLDDLEKIRMQSYLPYVNDAYIADLKNYYDHCSSEEKHSL